MSRPGSLAVYTVSIVFPSVLGPSVLLDALLEPFSTEVTYQKQGSWSLFCWVCLGMLPACLPPCLPLLCFSALPCCPVALSPSSQGETLSNPTILGDPYPNHCQAMFGAAVTHRVRLLFDGGVTLDGPHTMPSAPPGLSA